MNLKEAGLKKASSDRLRKAVRSQRLAGTEENVELICGGSTSRLWGRTMWQKRVDFLNFLNYCRQLFGYLQ